MYPRQKQVGAKRIDSDEHYLRKTGHSSAELFGAGAEPLRMQVE